MLFVILIISVIFAVVLNYAATDGNSTILSKDVGSDDVSIAITGDVMFGRKMPSVLSSGDPFRNVANITKNADIVVVATGTPKKFNETYFSNGQTVIDAGINWDPVGKKLCGDVDFESVKDTVYAITPVPGGVGSVTSAILIQHTIS